MPSTVIRSIDYDVDQQVLKITFRSGAVYAYYKVPDEVYIDLMKARSRVDFLTSTSNAPIISND